MRSCGGRTLGERVHAPAAGDAQLPAPEYEEARDAWLAELRGDRRPGTRAPASWCSTAIGLELEARDRGPATAATCPASCKFGRATRLMCIAAEDPGAAYVSRSERMFRLYRVARKTVGLLSAPAADMLCRVLPGRPARPHIEFASGAQRAAWPRTTSGSRQLARAIRAAPLTPAGLRPTRGNLCSSWSAAVEQTTVRGADVRRCGCERYWRDYQKTFGDGVIVVGGAAALQGRPRRSRLDSRGRQVEEKTADLCSPGGSRRRAARVHRAVPPVQFLSVQRFSARRPMWTASSRSASPRTRTSLGSCA